MDREYILGSASDLARQQLSYLTHLFDDHTRRALDGIDIQAGQRCLDIGAGSGTATQMLLDRVGDTGKVVAADIDLQYIDDKTGAEVVSHDIHDGVPSGGPFDVIHSRFVLMHLSRRLEILQNLVDALNPGGWLVIGDFGAMPRPISTPAPEDMDAYNRVHEAASYNAVSHGVSWDWAAEADTHMERAGLQNISGTKVTNTGNGGDIEARLSHNYGLQLQAGFLKAGAVEADVKRYLDLWLDPKFRARFYDFYYWVGQKPVV